MANPITDETVSTTGALDTMYVSNERPLDMYPSLFETYPEVTPLTVLFNKLGQKNATQETMYWFEKREMPYLFQVASAVASGGGSVVVVANGDTVQKNTQLYNVDKDEIALVTANGSSNTLTITKGSAGTTAVAWTEGDILVSLLPAETEGSTEYTNIHYVAPTSGYNYQQLIRIQFGMTRTADKLTTYWGGPGSKRLLNQQQHYDLARKMSEFQVAFGGRASSSSGTTALRMGGGLRQFLYNGTNFKNFNGAFTETGFNNWLADYCDQNPDIGKSVVFAGASNMIRRFSDWGRDAIQVSPRSTEYGLRIKTYVGADIDVDLVPMPLFTHGAMRGMGFLIDSSRALIRPMVPMTLHQDLLGYQSEIIYDLYREITSFMLADERRHGMCVGATN